ADGTTLATGDRDGTIRLRDPETGRVKTVLRGHSAAIDVLTFAPDGRRLASFAELVAKPPQKASSEVYLWDLSSAKVLARIDGVSDRIAVELRFGAQGERLWERAETPTDGRRLRLWDVATEPTHPRLLWDRPTKMIWLPVTSDGAIAALENGRRRLI